VSIRSLLRSLGQSSVDGPRTAYGEARTQVGHVYLGLLVALPCGWLWGLPGLFAPVIPWAIAEWLQWRPGAGPKMVRDALKDGFFWAMGAWAAGEILAGTPVPDAFGGLVAGLCGAAAVGAFLEDQR